MSGVSRQSAVGSRQWVLGAALVLGLSAGCATTPEPKVTPVSTTPPVASRLGEVEGPGETPEIPEPTRSEVSAVNGERPAPPAPPVPAVDPAAKAAFERGVAASLQGDWAGAQRALEEALRIDPKLAYAWTNLGVVHERKGDLRAAEGAYEKAIALDPEQEIAWDYLTRLRCRTGRASDVEARLRLHLGNAPGAIGARIALVYALLHQNKLESAANEAKKILKADERNVRAMQLLAQVYHREKKHELAKMVLDNAKAIAPNDAATWNALGLVHLALKARPQAMESFRQAVALQPDFAEANNNYGALLNDAHDFDTAVRVLEAAVAAAPEFAAARLNLGNAYRGKGELKKAIAQYEQVLRLRPSWVDTYYNLAILHLDSELEGTETIPRLEKSIAYFKEYERKGGKDERVEQYLKDANKGIEKEARRMERLEKDKLRKAAREAEEKKKAEEEAKLAAVRAAEEKAAAEKLAADKAAAENLAAEKAAAEKLAAEKSAAEKAAAEKAAAEKAAAEAKKKAANVAPASKLGDDDDDEVVPANSTTGSSKLGDDDK